MPPTAAMALKEWAAVCAALAAGRQSILLRKGGIAEGPGGFRPEHAEFWLLPTFFHERPAALKPDDRRFFESSAAPPTGRVRIELFARVAEVHQLDREELLDRLVDQHVYGEETVRDRFRYRRPGLWLLVIQVFRAPSAVELPEWPELAGCYSWVELPESLPTDGLTSVFDPAIFDQRTAQLRELLSPAVKSSVDASPIASPMPLTLGTADARSPLDMAAILERFDGDKELVERLFSIYRQDRSPWMSRALGALVQQDAQELIFAAHRLRGLLGHFEPSPASQTAGRLEQCARQGDFAAAQAVYGQLDAELAELDVAVDAWMKASGEKR